jgi:hypothetical protein
MRTCVNGTDGACAVKSAAWSVTGTQARASSSHAEAQAAYVDVCYRPDLFPNEAADANDDDTIVHRRNAEGHRIHVRDIWIMGMGSAPRKKYS